MLPWLTPRPHTSALGFGGPREGDNQGRNSWACNPQNRAIPASMTRDMSLVPTNQHAWLSKGMCMLMHKGTCTILHREHSLLITAYPVLTYSVAREIGFVRSFPPCRPATSCNITLTHNITHILCLLIEQTCLPEPTLDGGRCDPGRWEGATNSGRPQQHLHAGYRHSYLEGESMPHPSTGGLISRSTAHPVLFV